MKQKIVLVLAVIALLISCKGSGSNEPDFTVETATQAINFSAVVGASQTIAVTTADPAWKVTFDNPEDEKWLTATANLITSKAAFKPKKANTELLARVAKVWISTADDRSKVEITVTQIGTAPALLVDKPNLEIPEAGSTETVTVTTNIEEYEIIFSNDWMSQVVTKAMVDYKHSIVFANNTTTKVRIGTITFKSKNTTPEVVKVVEVIQEGGMPLTIPKDIKITPTAGRALNSEWQSGQGVEKSYDGDMNTIYHSRYGGLTSMPVTLEYDMPVSTTKIDYILYNARNDGGNNGFFGLTEVWANTNENPQFVKLGEYPLNQAGASSAMVISGGIVNPKTFRIIVKDGMGGYASCAEMEFYKSGETDATLAAAIDAVFTSSACMTLKPSVTDLEIQALPSILQIIAVELKAGTYPREFRCESYAPYSSPEQWGIINRTRPYSKLDNPTGIEIQAGQKFYAFVGSTHGNGITLLCVTDQLITGDSYILHEGINEFTAKNTGTLYIQYYVHDLSAASAKPIEVHFPKNNGGDIQGYFSVEKHKTVAELERIINLSTISNTKARTFPLQGKHVQLNFLKQNITGYSSASLFEALGIWDEIISDQWDLLSINEGQFPTQRNNRQIAISNVNPDAYMHATNYYTFYESRTIADRTNKAGMFYERDRMWGPGHEFGHQNDNAISWHGYSEASNNLFSNLNTWKFANKYNTGFKTRGPGIQMLKHYSKERSLNFMAFPFDVVPSGSEYDSDGLFLELRLTWQLYVYYHVLGKDTQFFPKFFTLMRASTPEAATDPQAQSMQFYRIACEASQLDLTEFFEAWGWFNPINKQISQYGTALHFLYQAKSDAAKLLVSNKNYPKAPPIQYIEDRTVLDVADRGWNTSLGEIGIWTTFRDNPEISTNIKYSITGTTVTVTNGGNAVAYEVRDGSATGAVKDFSVRHSFITTHLTGTNKLYAVRANGDRVEISRQ